jgi:hypothetical protein
MTAEEAFMQILLRLYSTGVPFLAQHCSAWTFGIQQMLWAGEFTDFRHNRFCRKLGI